MVARPGVDPGGVALRKESVDRNVIDRRAFALKCKSLSARRAWIEIPIVDVRRAKDTGRSPQGERG